MTTFRPGDIVRAERDEQAYPPRGTWARYRGRIGTVVQINRRDGEIGVTFAKVTASHEGGYPTSWFRAHELTILSSLATAPPSAPGSTQTAEMGGGGQ